MNIAWSALGTVFAASLGAVAAVVVLFGLGVLALSQYSTARAQGSAATASAVGAGLAFVICAIVALFGIVLIVLK
jgi:hypothetical protein